MLRSKAEKSTAEERSIVNAFHTEPDSSKQHSSAAGYLFIPPSVSPATRQPQRSNPEGLFCLRSREQVEISNLLQRNMPGPFLTHLKLLFIPFTVQILKSHAKHDRAICEVGVER